MPSWPSARPTWVGVFFPGLVPGLGGVEIVAAPVAVQRAGQALRADHLAQALEGAHGAFLLDQERRVDLGCRVVQGDDQIEAAAQALDPLVRRAVLMQHHAAQRAARALLAVRPAAPRPGHQPGPLKRRLGPGIAKPKPVIAHQVLVEMLDREAPIARSVELQHAADPVHRNPPRRGRPQTPVVKPLKTFLLITAPPATERPLAHPQNLRRLRLAQLAALPSLQYRLELHPPQSLQYFRPAHPNLPM